MSETSPLRSPQRFSPAGESVRYPQCRGDGSQAPRATRREQIKMTPLTRRIHRGRYAAKTGQERYEEIGPVCRPVALSLLPRPAQWSAAAFALRRPWPPLTLRGDGLGTYHQSARRMRMAARSRLAYLSGNALPCTCWASWPLLRPSQVSENRRCRNLTVLVGTP